MQKADILKQTDHFNSGYYNPGWSEKQAIFLVLAGKKPLGEAASAHYVIEGTTATATPDDHAAVGELLSRLGLAYALTDRFGFTIATVSLDQPLVDQYVATHDMRIIGKLFGFPATAVAAFDTNKAMDGDEQDRLLAEAGLANAPGFFRFSKDHAQEELAVVRDWYQTLLAYRLIQQ